MQVTLHLWYLEPVAIILGVLMALGSMTISFSRNDWRDGVLVDVLGNIGIFIFLWGLFAFSGHLIG